MVREPAELEQHQREEGSGGPGAATSLRYLLLGVVLALFVVFCVVNTDGVSLHYVFGTAHDLPLIVVMAVSAAVGALLGALVRFRRHRS